MSLDDMCKHAQRLGIAGIDLTPPAEFPILKKYGLVPTMGSGAMSLAGGCNRKEDHPQVVKAMLELIDASAEAGVPNVIALSGNRRGMPDAGGQDNVVEFFNKVKGRAEEKRRHHLHGAAQQQGQPPRLQCDRTAWGVEVCKRVGSPRVKLLYDIYHMQIMEGDVIRTIRDNIALDRPLPHRRQSRAATRSTTRRR